MTEIKKYLEMVLTSGDNLIFKGVSVLHLTTAICGGDLRVFVATRDKLQKDYEVCANEICTLDLSRIDESKLLTAFLPSELAEVSAKLTKHLGF